MNSFFKKSWPYLLAIVIFAAIACIYMSPALDGKIIGASDSTQANAAVHESVEFHKQTGDYSWWNGSMFSGMPGFQLGGGHYTADSWLQPLKNVLHAGHRSPIAIVLIYLISFYILLLSLKVNKWLALAGAVAIAFSSYFFVIIAATHNLKTSSLSLMTLAIAGFCLVFNGHRKTGAVLTLIGVSVGMYPHPQMAYYLCFIIGFFFLAELAKAVRSRRWKAFGISTAIYAAVFLIGAGTGTAATFANIEYAGETMRGGHSDLVKDTDAGNKTGGLDLDYATAWSYGIDETWTFLIPNYMGGASGYNVGKDSRLYEDLVAKGVPRKSAEQFCESAPTYWGDKPFTAGPVYMGAIVCLLFVLGLFLVKGPYKWALLGVTVLSVLLSWGSHFMGLTELFFKVVPLYNKFRAVESILVIAEITVPVLGFLALRRITEESLDRKEFLRAFGWSLGITGGLCLFMALFGPSFVSFTTPNDDRVFAQMPEWLSQAVIAQRESMMVSDAWRSLLFILQGAAAIYIYVAMGRKHTVVFSLVLAALILLDMWPVDKRFMNDRYFTSPKSLTNAFKEQPWETRILADKEPGYRVMNLTVSTFNDARTSYRLKSVGGYSPAKLRRYQDLIDEHISKMHMPVLNMLNTKYFIVPAGDQNTPVPQINPEAMGSAWFVDSLAVVDNANAESEALMQYDLSHVAVLDREFAASMPAERPVRDSLSSVRLTSWSPKELDYEYQTSRPGTIVFSEIYYPYGWKATIDGEAAEHYRVNYMLRALNVPAGNHKIHFVFEPDSVAKGNVVSMIFVILMYLIIIGAVGFGAWQLFTRKASE